MKISEVTEKKLLRMYELQCIIAKEADYNCDDEIYAEYRALLKPMVEEFSPVVVMLVKAGLITMAIQENGENILHPSKRAVQLEPDCVSDNGTICLHSSTVCGYAPTHLSECKDKTCPGCNVGRPHVETEPVEAYDFGMIRSFAVNPSKLMN